MFKWKYAGTAVVTLGLMSFALAAPKKNSQAAKVDPQMEQAMKLGAPGANHQALQPLVGKFSATVRGWMKPGDQPQESHGTSENAMILGGRYLQEHFTGDWGGQPFEGFGTIGYDNMKGEYESTWIDNFSTGQMTATGTFDSTAKTLKLAGTFSCPMSNETSRWFRSEWTVNDDDTNTYTTYFKSDQGQEFKAMEIVYKRIAKT